MTHFSKFVSIILALVLMLGCCSALAATTEANSNTIGLTVKQYVLSITVGDDLILWTEDAPASSTISVTNGSGDRTIVTKVLLKVGSETKKEVTGTTVTAADIRAAAGTTDEAVIVTIVTSESKVTKNGVESTPVEATAAEVLVINDKFKDNPDDDNKPDAPASTGLMTVSITGVPATDVFPGDKYTITATTNAKALKDKIGTKATVNVISTQIYRLVGATGTGSKVGTMAENKESATYEETAGVNNTQYRYWAVAKATITED